MAEAKYTRHRSTGGLGRKEMSEMGDEFVDQHATDLLVKTHVPFPTALQPPFPPLTFKTTS